MRNKYTLIVSLCGVAAISLWLFVSLVGKSTITIRTPSTTPNNNEVTVKITREGKIEKSLVIKAGDNKKIRLKKGMVRIDSSAGNLQAVDIVNIGITKEILAPDGSLHNSKKIGSNAVFCPLSIEDKLFSYNCLSDGIVVRHQTTTQSSAMYGGQVFASLKPVSNGLMGLYPEKLNQLIYLDLPTESIKSLSIPASAQALIDKEFPQITTSTDPGASNFALVFSQANKIFLFKDINDTNPVEITPQSNLAEDGRSVTFSLSNKQFILYVGNAQSHDDDHGDGVQSAASDVGDVEHNLPSYIYEYSQNGKLEKTIDLDRGFEASSMHKLTDKYYEAEVNSNFKFYYLDNKKLKLIYEVNDISSWVNLNNKVYLQTNGVVYKFTPGENGLFGFHSAFGSKKINVSQVFTSKDGLVFTGTMKASPQPQQDIYRLLDSTINYSTPEAPSDQVVTEFKNFSQLLDYGMSSDQLNELMGAIKSYIDSTGKGVKISKANNVNVIAPDRLSVGGVYTATVYLSLDNKQFKLLTTYSNLTETHTLIYDQDDKLLFDSKRL